MMYCSNCGSEVDEKAVACTNCGLPPRSEKKFCYNCGVETEDKQVMCVKCGVSLSGVKSDTHKKKTIAGVLGILLGGLGAHKFYHGSWGFGIIYIVFIWTFIPGILGLIEGIIYLTMDEYKYHEKYNEDNKSPFKW
jgi:TM2 domain-containing membrane protein YozV